MLGIGGGGGGAMLGMILASPSFGLVGAVFFSGDGILRAFPCHLRSARESFLSSVSIFVFLSST